MVAVYVFLIQRGLRTLDKVPMIIREDVKQALIDEGLEEFIPEEPTDPEEPSPDEPSEG